MGSTLQKWVSAQSIERTSDGERPRWGISESHNNSPTFGAFVRVIAEDMNAFENPSIAPRW